MREIGLKDVVQSKHNPRVIAKGDRAIEELAASIEASGLLQPVVCRPMGEKFELLAGARRYAAHEKLGRKTILAIVRDLDDVAAIRVTVLENLQRANLTPMEEARGVKELLDAGADMTSVAADIGRSVQWVARRRALSGMAPAWVKLLEAGKTSVGHAELACAYPAEVQEELAKEPDWMLEPGRLGEFRRRLNERSRKLAGAPWGLDDATLDAIACSACQRRSGAQPELWAENGAVADAQSRCLDGKCWAKKQAEWVVRAEEEARKEHPKLVKVRTADDPGLVRGDEKDGVLDHYAFAVVKKAGPGVLPALVVHGPGAGKVVLVKPHSWAMNKADQTARKPGEKAPLAVRKKQLEMRRKGWVIGHVAEALTKSTLDRDDSVCPVNQVELLGMAAAFGTDESERTGSDREWKAAKAFWKVTAPAQRKLWAMVAGVLQERMKYWQVQACETQYEEALRIAELLKMPKEKALMDLAAKELREPAVWALEEAQGKKKEPKGKAKKAPGEKHRAENEEGFAGKD